MINMKDKFMCISIREDGYGIFSNGGWASYNKEGKITGSCGDINSFPASLSISIAGKKDCDTNKTLEQRISDLEKQVTHEPLAAGVFKGVLNIKDNQIFMREAFIDTAWLRSATPDSKVQSENYVPGKSGFLIDYSTGKAEFNGKIVIHKQNGDVACVMGPLVTDTKTLEQRVADLEKQLAETSQAANDKMETIKTQLDNVWMMVSKSPILYDAGMSVSTTY
ncbi:phage tail tip fiber protein [Morganella morganii]|uniref:phage tail tip fiber protein n=1 Tax=Morganella morganii TaxID=582 RepID=UPI0034D7A5E0